MMRKSQQNAMAVLHLWPRQQRLQKERLQELPELLLKVHQPSPIVLGRVDVDGDLQSRRSAQTFFARHQASPRENSCGPVTILARSRSSVAGTTSLRWTTSGLSRAPITLMRKSLLIALSLQARLWFPMALQLGLTAPGTAPLACGELRNRRSAQRVSAKHQATLQETSSRQATILARSVT